MKYNTALNGLNILLWISHLNRRNDKIYSAIMTKLWKDEWAICSCKSLKATTLCHFEIAKWSLISALMISTITSYEVITKGKEQNKTEEYIL